MKAAVSREVGQIAIEELEDPSPGPGEVKIRVVASGLCGTDRSVLEGHLPVPRPIVLGHEGAGHVVEVGDGVTSLAPGDPVICSIVISCGRCYPCVRGEGVLCERNVLFSGRMLDGGTRLRRGGEEIFSLGYQGSFAEYAIVPECAAVRVPGDTPLEVTVGLACGVSTGLGAALVRAPVEPGSRVLVIGAGGVGLSVMMGARALGAARVWATDLREARARRAVELGLATDALPAGDDLARQVREQSGGRGVDRAYDAVGAPGTLETALAATRPGGTVVVIGHAQARVEATVDTGQLLRQKTLTGTYGGSIAPHRHIPEFLEMHAAGRIDVGALFDARYPLGEIGRALDDMREGRITRAVITC